MTAEQQAPTPGPLGPLARYEQNIIDRITDFNDPHQEWRRLSSELLGTFFLVLAAAGGARAVTWEHVDLDGNLTADPPVPPHVAVWRSVRAHGDTKTDTQRTKRSPQLALPATHGRQVGDTGIEPATFSV